MPSRKKDPPAAKPAVAKAVKSPTGKPPKFPKTTLEKALQIPYAVKDKNGGNPWEPDEIRQVIGVSQGNAGYSQTASSRDYALTNATPDTPPISLTPLHHALVYTPN